MRLNHRAFEKCLRTDGELYKFWKYDTTGTIEYDENTQLPTNPGELIETHADVLDFSIYELKNAGGLIDTDSKKFVVAHDISLNKGDEILNSSMEEVYRIVNVLVFANRKHLYANKVTENPNTHS